MAGPDDGGNSSSETSVTIYQFTLESSLQISFTKTGYYTVRCKLYTKNWKLRITILPLQL
jgi:hypothetical protein